MFRLDIRVIDDAVLELQSHIRKLNQAIGETESVVSGLSVTSGMWQVRNALQKEVEKMEAQMRSLQDMLKFLREIQSCYKSCERNIISHVESVFVKPRADFEWVQYEPVTFNKEIFYLY